jgi:hypothetical protein
VVVPLDANHCKPGDQVHLEGDSTHNGAQITYEDFAKVQFSVKDKNVFVDGKKLVAKAGPIMAHIADGAKVR